MLVQIEPCLTDERFLSEATDKLILSTRFKPYSLYPAIRVWPSHVYVACSIDPAVYTTGRFEKDQVKLLAWGVLFDTLERAQAFVAK
jgi:hypothetical protein